MEKVVVYPFEKDMVSSIRYWNNQKTLPKIVSVVMLQNKKLEGKDIGVFYNQGIFNIMIYSKLESALEACDTLLVPGKVEKQEDIFEILKMTITKNKNVICMCQLTNQEKEDLMQLSKTRGVMFQYNKSEFQEQKLYYIPDVLYKPMASIIMVGEMYSGLDGVDVALHINKFMKEKGYKSIAVLEDAYFGLDDLFPYPQFLKGVGIQESNKIYYLNNYIKFLESMQEPDVIVMKIPEAMLKYSDRLCMGFGVLPFLVSQAVRADYFVFCTQYEETDFEFYNMLDKGFEGRYGFGIDCIHMSNVMMDIQDTIQKDNISTLRRKQEEVDELLERNYSGNPILILNCLSKEGCNRMGNHIIERLSGYGNVFSVL